MMHMDAPTPTRTQAHTRTTTLPISVISSPPLPLCIFFSLIALIPVVHPFRPPSLPLLSCPCMRVCVCLSMYVSCAMYTCLSLCHLEHTHTLTHAHAHNKILYIIDAHRLFSDVVFYSHFFCRPLNLRFCVFFLLHPHSYFVLAGVDVAGRCMFGRSQVLCGIHHCLPSCTPLFLSRSLSLHRLADTHTQQVEAVS